MTRIHTGPHIGPYCNPVGPYHKIWPRPSDPIWEFTWYLGCTSEGLQIWNARYHGQEALYKASAPLLRVQYDPDDNGRILEFRDDLNEQNSAWIDTYEGVATNAPIRYFAIDTYYNRGIGKYRILQRWVFWETGEIWPRVFSAGEQNPRNHRHHQYWRFDFDVGSASNNVALEWQGYGDRGYGDGWLPIYSETTQTKQVFFGPDGSADRTSWAVVNKATRSGYQIIPGVNDGVVDTFSRFDLAVELYHPWEDLPGTLGNAQDDHVTDFINGEGVDGQDVVVWYVGHLFHDISDHGRDWHETGPNLVPVQLTMTAAGNPTVRIIAPIPNPNVVYLVDQIITFQATAHDANIGAIAENNVVWTDNVDGFLGTGSTLPHTLSAGVHHVTVTVTDSVGRSASDTITILVTGPIL